MSSRCLPLRAPLSASMCSLVCLCMRPLFASACSLACLCVLPFLPLIGYPDYCLPFPHPFLLLVIHFLPTCMSKCVPCVHAQAHHLFFICVPTLPQLVLSVCPFVLCSVGPCECVNMSMCCAFVHNPLCMQVCLYLALCTRLCVCVSVIWCVLVHVCSCICEYTALMSPN